MGVWIAQEEWAILGWENTGMSAVGLQRSLDLATEMGTFEKGSGTWESVRRGLVYFQFGFGATMRPFVKLLWPLVNIIVEDTEDYEVEYTR